MKKKLLSLLVCVTMVVCSLTGCSKGSSTESKKETEGEKEADPIVLSAGDESGVHLNMWSFVEVHNTFYAKMVEEWNKKFPDQKIYVTFTTYPYADMNNKLTLAIQSKQGAPDMCDIEIGAFPTFLEGDVDWFVPMNDYVKEYQKDIVQSRLDAYSKDGKYYGIPTHVGATVMYYNDELLSKYGIDYKTIKTWDDYTNAAKLLKQKSNGEVKMTSVDTGGTDWLWLAMAEYGEDWTSGGKVNVELESLKNMLKMQQGWLKDDLCMVSTDGHVDLEAGYANVSDGKIASFPKAMWYMSRFLNYMPEMKGKYAIAPCPVFKEGQARSVGIGGTGTVATKLEDNKNSDLAAKFITWAKLSKEGEVGIWNELGFDTCNTSIWTDKTITQDKTNQYISFFKTNPFDTLNEIKNEIGRVAMVKQSIPINEQILGTTLNEVLDNGDANKDVDEALKEAQEAIELELEE